MPRQGDRCAGNAGVRTSPHGTPPGEGTRSPVSWIADPAPARAGLGQEYTHKWVSVPLFQALDLLAERRLSDSETSCGAAEVELLREHDERMELRQGEFGTFHIRTYIKLTPMEYWTYRRQLPYRRRMTERRFILSGSTFEEQIGYARAVVIGDWVHVSGTTGFDYTTMTISDDVVEQARQCLRNIEAALTEAGCTFSDVVRVRYLLPDRNDFEPCWPVLQGCFGEVRPAATMLVCGLSDPRMKIEIEAYAHRSVTANGKA
jgi:enamine deaminase RidA (YjgF/YER057c/UK114 family)